MSKPEYFEDFAVGDTFATQSYTLSREECVAFARMYDPQPFHLDDKAAQESIFRRLAASGWHTAAVIMRLIVRSGFLEKAGILGTGIDDLRWLAPVFPGDTLHVTGEIIALDPDLKGRPFGRMRVQLYAINQNDVRVMSEIANLTVGFRPA
jgi:acyl dehydratase